MERHKRETITLPKLLKTDGTTSVIVPENGCDFQCKQLYEAIGCDLIEVVDLRDGTILIIDEEGKLKQDGEVNFLASFLAIKNKAIHEGDVIVGNAVLCCSGQLK